MLPCPLLGRRSVLSRGGDTGSKADSPSPLRLLAHRAEKRQPRLPSCPFPFDALDLHRGQAPPHRLSKRLPVGRAPRLRWLGVSERRSSQPEERDLPGFPEPGALPPIRDPARFLPGTWFSRRFVPPDSQRETRRTRGNR